MAQECQIDFDRLCICSDGFLSGLFLFVKEKPSFCSHRQVTDAVQEGFVVCYVITVSFITGGGGGCGMEVCFYGTDAQSSFSLLNVTFGLFSEHVVVIKHFLVCFQIPKRCMLLGHASCHFRKLADTQPVFD